MLYLRIYVYANASMYPITISVIKNKNSKGGENERAWRKERKEISVVVIL